MHEKLYALKREFLNTWSIQKLEQMTLEEYTNLDKTSFCYWIEHITRDLGSIVGGSSYKFGIYKRSDRSEVKEESNRTTDGTYAWFKKYGEQREEAYNAVKTNIIKIAKAAQENNLKIIDAIDLGNAYKWKIAFLYGDYNCLNAFKLDALHVIASNLNIDYSNKTPISQFHKDILNLKPKDQDYYSWSHKLWKQYEDRLRDVKRDFAKWLNANTFDSYRAYLGDTNKSIEDRLDEINSFFDDVDFFVVDPNNVNGLVSTILFLLSKKERLKNPDFVAYDSKNSNGIPKAILGKNNYIKFLRENFNVTTSEINETVLNEENETYFMNKHSLNQILYGPPGTGKTFYLKNNLFQKYTSKQTSIPLEKHFESVVSSCSWWQVIAIALLEIGTSKVSDIFNNKWVQKKASLSNSKTIRPTIWSQLQSHTIDECEYVNVSNRQQPFIFNKTENSFWEILKDQVEELVPELY